MNKLKKNFKKVRRRVLSFKLIESDLPEQSSTLATDKITSFVNLKSIFIKIPFNANLITEKKIQLHPTCFNFNWIRYFPFDELPKNYFILTRKAWAFTT